VVIFYRRFGKPYRSHL